MHEQLIGNIRAAFETGASHEVKAAAAQACRMILAVLDPQGSAATFAPPLPRAPIAVADPLGAVLDAIITKYKDHIPKDLPPSPLNIPIVAIPASYRP